MCQKCSQSCVLIHRYKKANVECPHCGSLEMVKDLSTPINPHLKSFRGKDKKVGDEVYSAIKDGQEELKKSKKTITKRVYKK